MRQHNSPAGAYRGKDHRPPTFPGTKTEITVGATVYDRGYEMPACVRRVSTRLIELERPTGKVWSVPPNRLRPATRYEERQLTALGKLHHQQLRGLE